MFRRMFMLLLAGAEAVWRTVVRTGTGFIVANDTTENQPVKVELQGWTEQDSTTGAQLFDENTVLKDVVIEQDGTLSRGIGYYTSDFIKVDPSTAYYITRTRSKRGKFYDINKLPITTDSFSDFNPEIENITFNTPENAEYIRFSGITEDINNVMLNKGSTALPYEPYTGGQPSPSPEYPQEIKNAGKYDEGTQKWEFEITIANEQTDPDKNQTVTLTSDRPLTKWDKLEKRNGVWGWVYKSAEIVLDGSEDEAISLFVGSEREGNSFLVNIPDSVGGYRTSLCDKYRNINGSWNSFHKGEYAIYSDHMSVTNKNRYFRPPSAEVETVEQWRAWLSENPLTLWYETAEETFVPLSASEQEAMNALYTFRPTTVFSNDNEMFMQIEYQTKRNFGLKKPAQTTSMFNFGLKWTDCNRIILKASGMNELTYNMFFCGGLETNPFIGLRSSKIESSNLSNFEYSGYSNEIIDGRKFEIDFRFSSTMLNPVCNIWDSVWSKQIIYHEILFYKDDTLLADFIPDTSNADRMYNKVNGQYITASELGVYELVEV